MKPDHDTLIAYALGTLSTSEAQAVEHQLNADPQAQAELRSLQDALSVLVTDLPPEPLPASAERDLLERVRAQRPPRRLLWPLAIAAAVALLIVGVNSTPWFQNLQVQSQVQAYSTRPGAVTKPLLSASGHSAGLMVRLGNGQIFVAMNRAPGQGDRVYQLWFIEAGAIRSLGVFEGRSFESTRAALGPGKVGVTLEPPGGSDQPTSAPLAIAEL